jgi:uncharacterized protein YggU (UPF0235/DUF167 family)
LGRQNLTDYSPQSTETPTIKLPIKVVPASSRNCIAGWLGDTLKIRVTALTERGKANASVGVILAGVLSVSKEQIRIVTEPASARKTVEVIGLSESDVYRWLSKDAE